MASMTSPAKVADALPRSDRSWRAAGVAYALAGFSLMWVFWVTFVVFLANAESYQHRGSSRRSMSAAASIIRWRRP